MPGPLELPPISTAIPADVEQAAVDCGITRDQMATSYSIQVDGDQ